MTDKRINLSIAARKDGNKAVTASINSPGNEYGASWAKFQNSAHLKSFLFTRELFLNNNKKDNVK